MGGMEVLVEEDICIQMADSLHCTEKSNRTLKSNYIPINKNRCLAEGQ